jgi:uncharacterized protein YegL
MKIVKKENEKTSTSSLASRLKARSDRVKAAPPQAREHLVLLLDCSASMTGLCDAAFLDDGIHGKQRITKLEAVNTAVLVVRERIMARGAHNTCLQVVQFGTRARVVHPVDVGDDVMGGTNYAVGLKLALSLIIGGVGSFESRRIVLMSDGHPTDASKEEIWRQVGEACQYDVVIDTVAFGESANRDILGRIAKETGGVMLEADDADQLVQVFKKLDTPERGLLGSGAPHEENEEATP